MICIYDCNILSYTLMLIIKYIKIYMRNYKYEDHWGNGRIAISMQPDVRDAPRSSTRPRTQQRCRLAAAHAKPATGCTVHHRKLPSQGKMSAKWISTYSLYIYYNIYIYIIVYIYTSGDENITQWPSGDLFPQPAPFSTASGALPGVRGPQQPFAASKPSRPMPGFPPKPPGSAPNILSDQPINHGLPMDTP